MKDLYTYMVSDYAATGEGHTVSILIQVVFSYPKDPESDKAEGLRKFTELFGSYFAIGAEFLTHDEFMNQYGELLPDRVVKVLEEDRGTHIPGNFFYYSQVHVNYS